MGQDHNQTDSHANWYRKWVRTIGWFYHLFNSAVIGVTFGLLAGGRVRGYPAAAGWGAVYGLAWWVLGALVLMPVLLVMPAFAPLTLAPMVPVAMGSLVGHLIFGLILGASFLALTRTDTMRILRPI